MTPGLTGDNGVLTVYVRSDHAGGTVYSTELNPRSTKPLALFN